MCASSESVKCRLFETQHYSNKFGLNNETSNAIIQDDVELLNYVEGRQSENSEYDNNRA